MLEKDLGILAATTGFGKTVLGAYLISQKKVNTLVLVHNRALLTQWQKSLTDFLDIKEQEPNTSSRKRKKIWSPIGLISAGKNTRTGIIDIATMQSLIDKDSKQVKEFVAEYGMVIVDECHHVPAFNFEKVLKAAHAQYVYGLSATPKRADGHHPIITMQCGEIRCTVDAKTQAERHGFRHFVIPRRTDFYDEQAPGKTIAQIYNDLAIDDARNEMIIKDVLAELKSNRTAIILTERVSHVEKLTALLSEKIKHKKVKLIKLVGTMSAKEKRMAMEELDNIKANEKVILIASGRFVGEGFDYSRLETLFLALPIAWKGKVAQYVGRLHRQYPGKEEVRVYDYVDWSVAVLNRMYEKRVSAYKSLGYKIVDDWKAADK